MAPQIPRISVMVRKRPLNAKEKANGDFDILQVNTASALTILEPRIKYDLTKYTEKHQFTFDRVFPEDMDNHQIYQECARPLLHTVVDGGCATVFAYGQTGSGKTFTTMGYGENKGIYSMAAEDLFNTIDVERQYICFSFFEIYAGKLFDLLAQRKRLQVREDGKNNVVIAGLSEHPVGEVDELLALAEKGGTQRASGETGANATSSRSHGILLMSIRDRSTLKQQGKFYFIDLAGSERGADTTHCDRQTRLEGADINKSLLALKECIRSLATNAKHIPFRGSKLTMVLKDSFVGKSKAVMIAAASPSSTNSEHTLNTLRYAYRVKELKKDTGGQQMDGQPTGIPQEIEAPPPPRNPNPKAGGQAKAPRESRPEWAVPQVAVEGAEEDEQVIKARVAHEAMMSSIVEEEDDVLQFHRSHIDGKMDLIRKELVEMEDMDRGKASVDDYVANLEKIVVDQIAGLNKLRERLTQFQNVLKDEEVMTHTIMAARKGHD